MKSFRRFISMGLVMFIFLSCLPTVTFAADDAPLTTSQIKKKIDAYYTAVDPDNKRDSYWNKRYSTDDLIAQAKAGNYAEAVTHDGCKDSSKNYTDRDIHNKTGKGCQSNTFKGIASSDGIQCSGFADYMIYVIFGTVDRSDFYKAKTYNKYFTEDYEFYPGDLIRYGGHSMVVYKVKDGKVFFIECNYTGNQSPQRNCIIYKGTHSIEQDTLRDKIVKDEDGYIMIPKKTLRARVAPTVTAPTAKTGLICTGSAQNLLKAGKVKGGTMRYALSNDSNTTPANADFTTDIPTGTDAGTYYVWYKAVGDTNHTSTNPVSIKVEIAPVTFVLPDSITTIEEKAFEADSSIIAVDAHICTSISADAFKDCTGLMQIRLPQDCQIDDTAFSGCGKVTVIAPANGTTQAYCQDTTHNCVFKAE